MIFKKRALFLKKFLIPLCFKGAKSIALKNRALINAEKTNPAPVKICGKDRMQTGNIASALHTP